VPRPADDPPESVVRRRGSRWLTVSVRLSCGAMIAVALVLAWFAHLVREQRSIKEMILRNNGLFYYEFEPQNPKPYARKNWVPAPIRRLIDEEYFHDITWARIEGAEFGDQDLARLKTLDRIEGLGIIETAITDAGLRQLRGRVTLKGLFLGGNWIGDAGIDNLDLGSMPRLEVLELRSTLVSEEKLAEIRRRFPKLLLLTDGSSHRYIVPGEGREGNRMVQVDDPRLGSRRKIPPVH
jgi:hypothetical protein